MALPGTWRNTRNEFLAGCTRNSGYKKALERGWYAKFVKPLLRAQYETFKDDALDDVEVMIETGYAKLKVTQQKKQHKALLLAPAAMKEIKEWYAEMMEQGGEDFAAKAEERKVVRQNLQAHDKTHGKLDDVRDMLRENADKVNEVLAILRPDAKLNECGRWVWMRVESDADPGEQQYYFTEDERLRKCAPGKVPGNCIPCMLVEMDVRTSSKGTTLTYAHGEREGVLAEKDIVKRCNDQDVNGHWKKPRLADIPTDESTDDEESTTFAAGCEAADAEGLEVR